MRLASLTVLNAFVCVVLFAIPVPAQNAPKSIALTKSNVPAKENEAILKALQKKCPAVIVATDPTASDYTLELFDGKKKNSLYGEVTRLDHITLFDREGKPVRSPSTDSVDNAVKAVCLAMSAITVEVVDAQNLTQSVDTRSAGGIVNSVTGRRTLTDTSVMYVIVNDEHALLDCYERRKGCITIGPGKYYGEFDPDKRSIWVDHEIPLTHEIVRDHYVIAGSW